MKLLCLSNGHGEDAIAVRILQQLQRLPNPPQLAALPLVGEGKAYSQLENVPIAGPVQQMPSGGFIYMDGRQLLRDVRGGLLQLTRIQFQIILNWAKQGAFILAVGDIVPLLFAALSGANYAFVGTAKSEYYLRDEQGPLLRQSWMQRWEGWSGSVYLPWERGLMSHSRCQAVFPRDRLTTETLLKWSIPAYNLGNPMMDDLQPQTNFIYNPQQKQHSLTITLLPGSRPPEAYENWQPIAEAVSQLVDAFSGGEDRQQPANLTFLAAIAPSLEYHRFGEHLSGLGWKKTGVESDFEVQYTRKNATVILTQNFTDCLHRGDFAIAMAGTATEQFVGLGKPAIAIPGRGPQFTPRFAEAQSRLLGPSLILVEHPREIPDVVRSLINDQNRLKLIAENGQKRMGQPGAAYRIAQCLIEKLI
ncbi:lipid-A-disaccharide synthase-related protein [Capilliphycus salinus ALCB114379]|uniref:lipid-A-disaccharide synthase-related protein n=1 Tax=Capilliphycus salinus TaxID=2768948 RepID=UPI0039A75912